jgi:membrane protein YdbS with pleckstrin-like domain
MARRHATQGSGPSVSRIAYFGGLAAGISTAVAGYYCAPLLELGILGTVIVEIGVVIVAFGVTKGIWKFSDWTHQLDSADGPQDGTHV